MKDPIVNSTKVRGEDFPPDTSSATRESGQKVPAPRSKADGGTRFPFPSRDVRPSSAFSLHKRQLACRARRKRGRCRRKFSSARWKGNEGFHFSEAHVIAVP